MTTLLGENSHLLRGILNAPLFFAVTIGTFDQVFSVDM